MWSSLRCGVWPVAAGPLLVGVGFALFAALLFFRLSVTTETVNVTGFRGRTARGALRMAAMMFFRRWCRSPGRPAALILAAVGILLAGLSKETGYVMFLALDSLLPAELGLWDRRVRLGTAALFRVGAVAGVVFFVLSGNRLWFLMRWLANYQGGIGH